jgi:hypothetical protein
MGFERVTTTLQKTYSFFSKLPQHCKKHMVLSKLHFPKFLVFEKITTLHKYMVLEQVTTTLQKAYGF